MKNVSAVFRVKRLMKSMYCNTVLTACGTSSTILTTGTGVFVLGTLL